MPEIAPMGRGWDGDNSLSGNERRRRTSELPLIPPGTQLGALRIGQSVGEDARPERLKLLGQGLRQSIAAQGTRASVKA